MFPEPYKNISRTDENDQTNQLTIESVLERLSDSSVHPRNKVNSFQWFHIPTLITTLIQSQQGQQRNEVLSQLLQRMMTVLDECFDCQTPIPNKRLLHSSLSQLSQSPSLDPKIKKGVGHCFVSLDSVDEGPFVVVETSQLDLIDSKNQTIAELQVTLSEAKVRNAQLEKEMKDFLEREKRHLSVIESLRREKEQGTIEMQRLMGGLKDQLDTCVRWIVSKGWIVVFSPDKFRVKGWTVTRINSDDFVGCFTKPVSKGIHRLSIKNESTDIMIGVLDAAEYPKHLTSSVFTSPKAAMMLKHNGYLLSADQGVAPNTKPQRGQEWSAEADLEKRTLHFFINGVQQQNHFINIPVPLVFAIDVSDKDIPIEITFWGELKQSSVSFEGTGHNLG
ncbi:hypothetical protein BLNAU_14475 [Blattamonas nauphoetae]|uniref:SPRY domain-containing protein n=1 Tax=Blattamonas nauphoetae TaxID=2049346 RepID=A0ABQ9XGY4_9EUKA|nr:hypothetical protein BLNAU_14475 [Blattamonas nauphoetae]